MRHFFSRRLIVVMCLLVLGGALAIVLPGRAALMQRSNLAAKPQAKMPAHGFDVSSLDRTCKPCQDFNQFANGGWMAANPIPPAYSRWGRFEELSQKNLDALHNILEAALKNPKVVKNSNEQKIADFYGSCMDEPAIEAAGINPLQPEITRINAINDLEGLEREVARLHSVHVPVLFGFGATQDFKDSKQVIAQVVQGGISLPDRDYYTKDDPRSRQIRDEYVRHVARMFELSGDEATRAAAEAKTVMDIETSLAEHSSTRVERRDPATNYHKMTFADLATMMPHFDWRRYPTDLGLGSVPAVNVGQPSYMKFVDEKLVKTPIDDWRVYLRWHLLNGSASTLSSKFVEENFNFNGKFLSGTKEILPRWKRCVAATDRSLGEALGQVYVQKTFTPETRAHAQEMVRNLIAALRSDLSTLSWMSEPTRQRAIAKLDAFVRKIGYPDKWRDYEALQISRGAYYNNAVSAGQFELRRQLGKIGKPVDKTEWGMTPPTVNAYYNPSMNEIVFPAGILQPPFYDPKADDAINYGGIGAVIGHEMTHGFDDHGAQFDADGNLVDWWTHEDAVKFKERTDCVVHQFDAFVVGDVHENGKLVVGESVADLGGLTISFAAFQKSLQGKPRPPAIDGFTPEQRFFLGWAQVWAENQRPEAERLQVTTNEHPLGRFRINGPLSNMPAFAEAFGCQAGDPMVRPSGERCQIW